MYPNSHLQMSKPLILILCTGNSCRSQMAEGVLQNLLGPSYEVASAGSIPTGFIHPLAIRAMAEIGIDISAQTSKHLETFVAQNVETIITVCGKADQACPTFPGLLNRHHFPFDDPAHASGTEDEQMMEFRRVRDDIITVFYSYAAGRKDEAKRAD